MAKAKQVVVFGVSFESKRKACIAYGHSTGKVNHRLARGMSLEEALTSKDRYTGAKSHPSYGHWNGMRSRCYSTSGASRRYKGRVTVCKRWLNNFWNFVEDMGEPPFTGASIDRKENSKGYSKSNCRWATSKQQALNRCDNVYIECFGKKLTIQEWSDKTGIHRDTITNRLKVGMSAEDALTKKVKA